MATDITYMHNCKHKFTTLHLLYIWRSHGRQDGGVTLGSGFWRRVDSRVQTKVSEKHAVCICRVVDGTRYVSRKRYYLPARLNDVTTQNIVRHLANGQVTLANPTGRTANLGVQLAKHSSCLTWKLLLRRQEYARFSREAPVLTKMYISNKDTGSS
jgi:hypothetical protein